MEEAKKRKLDETDNNCQLNSNLQQQASSSSSSSTSVEELRSLLDPLAKPQLIDLLANLGSRYPSIAQEIKSVASADPALRKLFVRGLAWSTTSDTLCAEFIVHGEIEEGAVISDKATGKSRGYGFITYKDMESALKALKAPSKMIDGRLAVCNLACESLSSITSTSADQALRKLFIGGLSPDTTSELLLDFFARHGGIEEGSVAYDKDTNKSRGFGFVTYKMVEAAKKAINDPQKILGGRNITVKLADNYKGKVTQTPVPAPVPAPVPFVPLHVPSAAGYPPTQAAHLSSGAPVGYNYPQHMTPFPNAAAAYTTQHAAIAPYSSPQILYSQYANMKEPMTTHASVGGYPYYMPKQ